ncbi:MAG: flagellar basal-body rod protein FlgF [Anaerolineae bacterium]
MNRGIYSVTSGMESLLEWQTRLAHNVANLNTPGFKQELAVLQPMGTLNVAPVRGIPGSSVRVLGPVGLGVQAAEPMIDYSQGALEPRDDPLALAISGEGFFRVMTPDGERYTRNGQFGRDAAGYLVTSQGYRVLGPEGPIQLPDGEIVIDHEGRIWSAGEIVGQLNLVRFPAPANVRRSADGLLAADEVIPVGPGEATIHQGFVERANVDVTSVLVNMMITMRAYESNQKILKMQDESVGRLLDLGRV